MFDELLAQLERKTAAIAVIGLGYVGLPLAVHFGRRFRTVGFDIKASRVRELQEGFDSTREIDADELAEAEDLILTDQKEALADCRVFVVTVPTPIDAAKRPDLRPLLGASATVGQHLKPGDLVVYESTVYPGATEEDCVPVLERESGLKYVRGEGNDDANGFFCGYSPERINPGDRQHRLPDIVKVTSGSTPAAAAFVDALYRTIIPAGTFPAASIRVAEAAKVIENTQRDLNIALVNELAILFARMDIDTSSVLAAAGSKWNFLPFKPGLVGGHCIGVDPYYLTHKAQSIGHHPEVILSGRRVNDSMGQFVAGQVLRLMARAGVYRPGAEVLVLGLTFKENCPDLRNTRVIDLIRELEAYNLAVDVHDPWVDPEEARAEYGIEMHRQPENSRYAAVVHAVAHLDFADRGPRLRDHLIEGGVLYDVRATLDPELVDDRL
ncbi:MAG: nucleotide sugar dehydrogenase [Wenzhouxiangella sp.]|jgi:UDP-N-acetyl-D-galactosamine dehydrogenase|nr:nucleotide sugar dehydrogenase [Wenzhouxiangella sp.]